MKKSIGMFAVAAPASILLVAWPGNAANAQAYWGYGVSGYTETERGEAWQGYYQAYRAGYQQGLSDAQAGGECSDHAQYYCAGYSQGFNTYENNSQQQTQTQGAEINVKGNGNYIGVNQEQSTGIGSYPALRDDNTGNGSIQPGEVNPSCKIICLTIIK